MRLLSLLAAMAITASSLSLAPLSFAQSGEFRAGGPLGTINEAGVATPMSANVRVFGSFRFSESCTFDPERNLILAMNAGVAQDMQENDGYVSLINPDGSVHTAKWIGENRSGLTLNQPLGSAIRNGILYVVDIDQVRMFDLVSGQPMGAHSVADAGANMLNGIGVTRDGTLYASNTRDPQRVYRVTADGQASVFIDGSPLMAPNGVAIDNDGNIVVVNIGNNAVLTFNPAGELINTEHAAESGNDGVIMTEDGTKYVSSVRFGSISRIRPGQAAEVIAVGIPSAASICYDSVQNQIVIPMNNNNALGFLPLD